MTSSLPAAYLYEGEGNFDAWLERMDGLLHMHRLQDEHHSTLGEHWNSQEGLYMYDHSNFDQVLAILRWNLSPGLMERVPAKDLTNLNDFIYAMFRHSKPFRIMDLPPELRAMIIELLYDSLSQDTQTVDLMADAVLEIIPVIAHVKCEFRSQTLGLHAAKTHFILRSESEVDTRLRKTSRLANYGFNIDSTYVSDAVLAWARLFRPRHLKLLRRVSIELPPHAIKRSMGGWRAEASVLRHSKLQFSFSKTGLEVVENTCLSRARRELLEEHVEAVGKTAEFLGLQGEALFMALTSNKMIWSRLALPLERESNG